MTSRDRVRKTLNHEEPDRVPLDLGSTLVTGIQAGMYRKFKEALGIRDGEIRVYDPFQLLAEVEQSVKQRLGVDTYGIQLPTNLFGYRNEHWKPFTLFDGTEISISGHFQYDVLANGDIVQYPKGDRSAPPSGIMPQGGYYFDVLVRQEPINEEKLDPREWVEQSYSIYTDEELRYLEDTSKWYFENTDYSLIGNFNGADFGDIALVPGPHVLHPKGIRDPQEWYISLLTRKSYIQDIFHYECDLQMKNLKMYREAVQDRIDVIVMSGTDYGSQNGLLISPELYREMFRPLHQTMNDWVHMNTGWKTFFHTCGSLLGLLDDLHKAGVDILNPVQISARGMEPESLKSKYGDKFIFWGGGIDPQHTLPFGRPGDVQEEVTRNLQTFKKGGGYVFANVHNIQSGIPVQNLLTLFKTFKDNSSYASADSSFTASS